LTLQLTLSVFQLCFNEQTGNDSNGPIEKREQELESKMDEMTSRQAKHEITCQTLRRHVEKLESDAAIQSKKVQTFIFPVNDTLTIPNPILAIRTTFNTYIYIQLCPT
jgi:hypothetical protein